MPCVTRPKAVFGFISYPCQLSLEHDGTSIFDFSQTSLSPPVMFILNDGVGLFAKRIEIILNTTPQMLRISTENFGLMQLTAAD